MNVEIAPVLALMMIAVSCAFGKSSNPTKSWSEGVRRISEGVVAMASGAAVPPDVPPHPPRERLQIIKHIVTKGGVNENGNVLTFICKVEGASSLSLIMSVSERASDVYCARWAIIFIFRLVQMYECCLKRSRKIWPVG